MDSVSQIVLGSAVGYAVLGNKIGRKAAIYGAVLGTLPDLDVLLPYAGEVEAFTYHRGFSHSILVQLVISPFLVWLITRFNHSPAVSNRAWFWFVFLCLSTHGILDSFTVYGTQLLWPITEYPFAVGNLFIIDPVYTLPLLAAFVAVLLPQIKPSNKAKINTFGLVISCLYISWSLAAKAYIDRNLAIALNAQEITAERYLSTPAPFSTLLWRVIVMSDGKYYEGYMSVFDSPTEVSLDRYQSSERLLGDIHNQWGVQRLKWFTKGFYSVTQEQQNIVLTDLRMGAECSYAFNFIVGQILENTVMAGSYEKYMRRPDLGQVGRIWHRIWDPTVSLAPTKINGMCTTNKS